MRDDSLELESIGASGLSLEACDDEEQPLPHTSDPAARIAQFCDLMAGHNWDVSPALMRADREYAMWQLARARAAEAPELRSLAAQLFNWFDERESTR